MNFRNIFRYVKFKVKYYLYLLRWFLIGKYKCKGYYKYKKYYTLANRILWFIITISVIYTLISIIEYITPNL